MSLCHYSLAICTPNYYFKIPLAYYVSLTIRYNPLKRYVQVLYFLVHSTTIHSYM